jgi:tellurite methyltransferase
MANKAYWNDFYKKGDAPKECSTFAAAMLPHIDKSGILFELGCGNGRDAFYFAKSEVPVWATDLSEVSIEDLNNKVDHHGNPRFVAADFTTLPTPFEETQFATVYSRFTLHAIKAEEASRALAWSFRNLRPGGQLLIEVRSVKDPLCGQGTRVEGEEDAWMTTHYRRFVRKDRLLNELRGLGFVIEYELEADNLAVFRDDNPVVIRVRARKPAAAIGNGHL